MLVVWIPYCLVQSVAVDTLVNFVRLDPSAVNYGVEGTRTARLWEVCTTTPQKGKSMDRQIGRQERKKGGRIV